MSSFIHSFIVLFTRDAFFMFLKHGKTIYQILLLALELPSDSA